MPDGSTNQNIQPEHRKTQSNFKTHKNTKKKTNKTVKTHRKHTVYSSRPT